MMLSVSLSRVTFKYYISSQIGVLPVFHEVQEISLTFIFIKYRHVISNERFRLVLPEMSVRHQLGSEDLERGHLN